MKENGKEYTVKSIHEDFLHLWFCRRSWKANMDTLWPMWPELCSLITLIFHIITTTEKKPTFAFWPAELVHLCGTRCSRWFLFEILSTLDNQKHSTHPPLADNTSSLVLAWGLSVVLDVHYTGSKSLYYFCHHARRFRSFLNTFVSAGYTETFNIKSCS